jgi:Family of unknown function (DUF5313)
MTRPGHQRYIANSVDRSLPKSIGDPTDSAATPRHPIHSMLPFLPLYAGVALLLPGSLALRAAALALAVLLALVDSFAFIAITRRPAQRYLPEDLEKARTARRQRT